MVKFDLRIHPNVLFAYSPNHIELILRVENKGNACWSEADVVVPEKISLNPEGELRKGRVRVGIIGQEEFLEKSVRVFANKYTEPQVYRCNITLYSFNKDGIIENRVEKAIDVRCEMKNKATI